MKVNEELDAIRTLGLNFVELLVVPRVLAMMVSLPVLTFVGMMAGMVGGAVVCALALDIPPSQFMAIVERDIALKHFLVGIRSEEHTSELQSRPHLVCRLLLEK